MIVIQAFLYFAPGHGYEKYLKLLISLLIIARAASLFLSVDLSDFFPQAEGNGGEIGSMIPQGIEDNAPAGISALQEEGWEDLWKKRIEKLLLSEIESNAYAGYIVKDVRWEMNSQGEFQKLRLKVEAAAEGENAGKGSIRIERILVEQEVPKRAEQREEDKTQLEKEMAVFYAGQLSLQKDQVEVEIVG